MENYLETLIDNDCVCYQSQERLITFIQNLESIFIDKYTRLMIGHDIDILSVICDNLPTNTDLSVSDVDDLVAEIWENNQFVETSTNFDDYTTSIIFRLSNSWQSDLLQKMEKWGVNQNTRDAIDNTFAQTNKEWEREFINQIITYFGYERVNESPIEVYSAKYMILGKMQNFSPYNHAIVSYSDNGVSVFVNATDE